MQLETKGVLVIIIINRPLLQHNRASSSPSNSYHWIYIRFQTRRSEFDAGVARTPPRSHKVSHVHNNEVLANENFEI